MQSISTDAIDRGFISYAGPATLVLWRPFAWDDKGAPKPRFVLPAELVLAGESELVTALSR